MIQAFTNFCLRGGDPSRPEVRQRCGALAGRVGIGANAALFAL